MKKRWITIALVLPLSLGLAFDNGLPYALVDHANRPVEERSVLWADAKVETLAFVSRDGTKLAGWDEVGGMVGGEVGCETNGDFIAYFGWESG